MPLPLALWITDHSCVCGNRWTHSYVTHRLGGTPSAQESAKGAIERIYHDRRITDHCYRCVSLAMNIGWQKTRPQSFALSLLEELKNV